MHHEDGKGTDIWGIIHCFSQAIRREFNLKWNSQDINQHSHIMPLLQAANNVGLKDKRLNVMKPKLRFSWISKILFISGFLYTNFHFSFALPQSFNEKGSLLITLSGTTPDVKQFKQYKLLFNKTCEVWPALH